MVWPLRTPKTNWMRLLKRQNALLRSSTKRRTHKPNWTRPLTRQKGWLRSSTQSGKIRRKRPTSLQIVPQTRKATTSTSLAPRASTSRARLVQHFVPVTEEEESETRTSGLESTPVLNIEEIGRYNVTVPVLTCTTCLSTGTANLADLIKNGRWPATVNCDTIYQVDLFSSFEELNVSAPGMSRLAFMRILEQRTDFFGRVTINYAQLYQCMTSG